MAATNVGGAVSGTWTKANSPYVLVDNVSVTSGTSLTIEPGVVVESNGYRFNVVGTLNAVGTAVDPIDLALSHGLTFYHGSGSSQIKWATLRNSNNYAAIYTDRNANGYYGSFPAVDHVIFRDNYIAVQPYLANHHSGSTVSITNSVFENNYYGIYGYYLYSPVSISGSRFANNYYLDILIYNWGSNSWNVSGSNLLPPSYASNCANNGGYYCTLGIASDNTAFAVNAGSNWWGATSTADISKVIYDGTDSPDRPVVSLGTIQSAPHDLYAPTSATELSDGSSIATSAGSLTGTAADHATAATGLASVKVSLQDLTSSQWWNGSAWASTETFLTATGTTSWSLAIPELTSGRQYKVRTMARDNAGNDQWGASMTTLNAITPSSDTTKPAAFTQTSPAADALLKNKTVTLSWGASSDSGSGLAGYEVWVDGTKQTTVAAGTTSATLTLSEGLHRWTIVAVDNAKNGYSTERRYFRIDTTAPGPLTQAWPVNNQYVSSTAPLLEWNPSTDTGSGINNYEVWIDGVKKFTLPATATSVTSPTLSAGRHQWSIVAADKAGFRTASPRNYFTVSPAVNRAVAISDTTFNPKALTGFPGDLVKWTNNGTKGHNVSDKVGLGQSGARLFDSGTIAKAGSFSMRLPWAGTFQYFDKANTALVGTFGVPARTFPATGTKASVFTLTLGPRQLDGGLVFDVQVKRPGTTAFVNVATNLTKGAYEFKPNSSDALGTYSFRVRLRNAISGKASGWSPITTVKTA